MEDVQGTECMYIFLLDMVFSKSIVIHIRGLASPSYISWPSSQYCLINMMSLYAVTGNPTKMEMHYITEEVILTLVVNFCPGYI